MKLPVTFKIIFIAVHVCLKRLFVTLTKYYHFVFDRLHIIIYCEGGHQTSHCHQASAPPLAMDVRKSLHYSTHSMCLFQADSAPGTATVPL